RIVEWRLPQRPQFDSSPAVRLRIVRLQKLCHPVHFLLPLLARHSRLDPCIRCEPPRASILQFVSAALEDLLHRRGHPELHRPSNECSAKALRSNTNNRVQHAIEPLRLSEHLRIALDTPL